MTDRDHRILDAAIAVFSRYGLRKATMGDIAEQAGVSRQTLYARHSNKDEIMAAAMKLIAERVCHEVTQGWGAAQDIGERLDIFLDCAVVRFFDQIRRMPDASDILTGHGDSARAAQVAAENGKLALLSDMFAPYAAVLASRGSSPAELAEFFYATASSFNFTAQDEAHLARLLGTLKQSTLTMLGEA
ncbi:MAG: helix-turn-helix domain-containing protein [Hoeflea sp.]|uniref:TetR/AcrR family transcriptional regulator n=1 Tax=Hoeflea sp. TaxID=1940281 RepID=UPI0032ECB6B2